MSEFKKFGLDQTIIENLKNQYITEPTPIQDLTINAILEGIDVIAEAQTGTGKTLAFLLPMLQSFDSESEHIQGLIITPTRELARQITKESKKITKDTGLKVLSVYGGQDINKQLKKLKHSIDLVVATPGRLLDHMARETIELKHLKTLVLDEADQMLHIGFKNEIERILKEVNKERQMLCFSATISPKVKKLAYRYMTQPKEISIKKEKITLENISQRVIKTSMRWKQEALFKELDEKRPFLSIIFCRTQRRVNELEEAMAIAGYNCARLHGGMKQSKRQRVMRNFKSADLQYLIATDVAARGIDVKNITHIYNYDFPESPEVYIHRIGRTGRMGEAGEAISLVAPREEETLQATEKKIKMKIPTTIYKK